MFSAPTGWFPATRGEDRMARMPSFNASGVNSGHRSSVSSETERKEWPRTDASTHGPSPVAYWWASMAENGRSLAAAVASRPWRRRDTLTPSDPPTVARASSTTSAGWHRPDRRPWGWRRCARVAAGRTSGHRRRCRRRIGPDGGTRSGPVAPGARPGREGGPGGEPERGGSHVVERFRACRPSLSKGHPAYRPPDPECTGRQPERPHRPSRCGAEWEAGDTAGKGSSWTTTESPTRAATLPAS